MTGKGKMNVKVKQKATNSNKKEDKQRSIHKGEEMWVGHVVEGTFVEKRATQSPTIENQQQNNLVHVFTSDSDEEMEDESRAHICDESEEEFDDTIDDTSDNDGTLVEANQDAHATSTPLEDSSQELTRNNTTDASVQTSLASSGSGLISNTCTLGEPIGDSSTDLANLLGRIPKCGAHAPVNIVSWKSIPDANLDLMWRDIQGQIKEKLNDVPQSEQTDSFKDQLFIDLVGSDGNRSLKTFGGGVFSHKVFRLRSSLRNTTSSHAIERMVQAQVYMQLEAKVAERVTNVVADQDAQIEFKVAAHVSNHEKAQMEWFKKLELLLGRELPPPSGYHAHMSG
uniref:Uncharacterized protein n=1 Tax=Tanacetum cinerariifolium TaxID=118510 RepID=A0A6L2MWN1_TANCI|nr:hypothetical protein [Tanacetum cinerariifolium]